MVGSKEVCRQEKRIRREDYAMNKSIGLQEIRMASMNLKAF
jgi:hypothetical protein